MSKLMQLRVDDNVKAAADRVFASIGLDTSTAVRMFLIAAIQHRGLPFEAKAAPRAIELNDGHGSYLCEFGHIHDYSKLDLGDGGEIAGPFESADKTGTHSDLFGK